MSYVRSTAGSGGLALGMRIGRVPSDDGPAPEAATFRVVIVDDIQQDRELLGFWLAETGRFRIVGEAQDGPAGVALAADLHPDLVTLDMSMPGGDGIVALREMLIVAPDSKVVVVSGFVTPDLVHATVDLIGATACLDKSIGCDRLADGLVALFDEPDAAADLPSHVDIPRSLLEDGFVIGSRLAAIVASSEDAIISKTLDGTVTTWNDAAERLYGYTAAEMQGQNISVLLPIDSTDELEDILLQVSGGRAIEHHETLRIRKDGTLVEVSLAVSPIVDSQGTVVGASTIARDVSARKRIDRELAHQSDDLRRSNEDLEQFAYVASHDLSEPLRTISSYVELLARRYRGQIDDDADRFIQHTVDGCTRMRHLIDDLLAFSRTGRADLITAAVDCSAVVRDVLADMETSLVETNAQVDCADLPTVRGDRVQLTQLFQNLIANGIKFSRPDVLPRIRVDAHRQGGSWVFSVSDNGIGIEAQYRGSRTSRYSSGSTAETPTRARESVWRCARGSS